MQAVLKQSGFANAAIDKPEEFRGRNIGILGSLFGCWHKRLTRPITTDRSTYRACLECGARKSFDTRTFRSSGRFYYPPTSRFGNF